MKRRTLFPVASIVAVGLMAMPALAIPVTQLDSGLFTYQYEMNLPLGSQDLDANGTSDWFSGTAAGVTQPSVAGGFGVSNQSTNPQQTLWRTDITNSLNRATVNGNFTLEASVRLVGDSTPANPGGFGFALQQPGQGQSLRFNVDETNVSFNNGTGAIATGSNSDRFHLYRIAFEGANNYWVWRDGILLNTNLATPILGSNGNFNNLGAWFLGDFTATLDGNWTADYIRVTEGSFAPAAAIPEPATAALLLSAVAAATLRRRRRSA